jgi:predicted nucleic acid-binding protein
VGIIIAALAVEHGCGVLHYDKHYDTIRDKAGLRFDSVWLAPRASLD